MSKLTSCEKFFIGRIALGLENTGYSISQEDIETLLSEGLGRNEDFVLRIKNALINSYCADLNAFKHKIVTIDPSSMWDESVIRLYKGRETLMRDIVIEWYSKYKKPGFLETIKKLFIKKG